MKTTRARIFLSTALLLGAIVPFVFGTIASADDNAADSIGTPTPSSSQGAGSPSTYSDARRIGVGLAWAPTDMVQGNGTDVFTNVGFVDARYWFNDRFGIDGGLGFGFPQVSPDTSFLATINIEPMLALVTRRHSIIYANLDLIPALNTGAGLPSAITFSGGIGIESQVTDIPRMAWFAQWNPVSLDWGMPNGGPTTTGVTFMGSLMNIMIGFHYYM